MLAIDDPYLAYCVDETLHVLLTQHQASQAEGGGSESVYRDLEGMGGVPPPDKLLEGLPWVDPKQAGMN